MAHLRWAAPGLPVEERNTHAFRCGQTAFAHNGGIYPLGRLSALLPPEWQVRPTGMTDSEHYFLAPMAEVEDGGAYLSPGSPGASRRASRRAASTRCC